jgi:hypothetical protein
MHSGPARHNSIQDESPTTSPVAPIVLCCARPRSIRIGLTGVSRAKTSVSARSPHRCRETARLPHTELAQEQDHSERANAYQWSDARRSAARGLPVQPVIDCPLLTRRSLLVSSRTDLSAQSSPRPWHLPAAMKIFTLDPTGYIGRSLALRTAEHGHQVVGPAKVSGRTQEQRIER